MTKLFNRNNSITVMSIGTALCLIILALSSAYSLKASGPEKEEPKHSCLKTGTDNFIPFKVEQGQNLQFSIPQRLHKGRASRIRGMNSFIDPEQGNCLACHKVSKILEKANPEKLETVKRYGFHGDIGPSLDGVATRFSIAELRLMLVDPQYVFPNTVMPSYYKLEGRHDVIEECKGRTLLSRKQIEDILAYLGTLK